ncbi:7K [Carlavirus latensaconiti]|uniref:Movement protein TGBp3 n=1 Tax=Carlavirus latensaconiti TaxID=101764 RepID=Q91UJ0_9VIRU|nr:7K protein [Aconitum latent virus]BAB56117.1 7K [Aconitum latent virus]
MNLVLICGLLSFAIALYFLSINDRGDCFVIITGESIRIQGCHINREFNEGLKGLRALNNECL